MNRKIPKDRKNAYSLCRNDLFLAAGLALAAIILFAAFFAFRAQEAGSTVCVTLNGSLYGTYPLDSDMALEIDSGNGHNTLVIRDGAALMEDADCPDRYCISKGSISKKGETIVCLPHRLVIEIRSENSPDTEEIDAIAE